ncbi:preprotein translocase subunit SecA [Ileibacterium valens]|uniref:preprotein translocase subunit SecA n=1 Tax=Ileibacterium valens TaxID=1862668 RepID=UPI0025702712|nr:preprotein translocase subunit SecA [Ileibacterium valens]
MKSAQLKHCERQAQLVLRLDEKMAGLSDQELRNKTAEFKSRLQNGESLDQLLPEAFAVVREACWRVRAEKPYPVQVIGAGIIHGGDLAEMETGSGKTLTSTMPVYLNALEGKGVHVVTVNEYLARRDAVSMGQVFGYLGLSVGLNQAQMPPELKRQAYACDITYSTNSELGFDYLRDNMARKKEDKVMRGLHYAVIDEADSVLIDEARTPLIISGAPQDISEQCMQAHKAVLKLNSYDYSIDRESQAVRLNESGITKIEEIFRIENLYSKANSILVHRINQALRANYVLKRDKDYLIRNNEIMIIDGFTGRVLAGRQYSEGLHQAIEAKEGVEIKGESKTSATITYQNFFRLYDKLSGMSGTAKTEEKEFLDIYNMRVIPVPPNKPIVRKDLDDYVYTTESAKYQAVAAQIEKLYLKGQPVLVGTASVEHNERISELLKQRGIPHEVLNAKNHQREAEIIAKAGLPFAVTIATNMAGRGTDIRINKEAASLGGLYVIGTEHHESRRIDNQLRGRSGRQGDPGVSRFYVSFEDEIIRRFSSEKFLEAAKKFPNDTLVESSMVTRSIKSAQKKVEEQNYETRKNLIKYDDVLRKQRTQVYAIRDRILNEDNIRSMTKNVFCSTLEKILERANGQKQLKEFEEEFNVRLLKGKDELISQVAHRAWTDYQLETVSAEPYIFMIERDLYLRLLDKKWQDHIDAMSKLRKGISLRSYAQNDPLQQYVTEAYAAFEAMKQEVDIEFTRGLCNIQIG